MKSLITSREVSRGQKDACITLVTDATRKATGVAIDELVERGVLTKTNIEKVRARGNEVVAAITALVKKKFAKLAENIHGYVKVEPISGAEELWLDATDGTETIAEATDTFPGWIDPNFERYGTNVASKPTKKTYVCVHEMLKGGTLAQIFDGLSGDRNKLVFTQPQIIQFVKKHHQWLRMEYFGSFFLFKVADEFFVVRVFFSFDSHLPSVKVHRFSSSTVHPAKDGYRLVVPKQALAN